MTSRNDQASNDSEPIMVRGARVNNLKNIDIDIPRHQLVVFTGVSGSGKSSLAFDTIAAESQRLLTETYPAFVQDQLPHPARPDVTELRNLTATIAVTQSPMASNPRSTVGTATDAISLLRQLFLIQGSPPVRSPRGLSFNSPDGACASCEGLGEESSLDPTSVLDETKSLNDGAITFPNFAVGSLFWKVYVRSGHFDNDQPIRYYTATDRHKLLHGTGPSVETGSYPMAYEGILNKIRRLYLSKSINALKPKLREAVQAAATTGPCGTCDGTRLNEEARRCQINDMSIAEVARLQVSDLGEWLARLQVPTELASLQERLRSTVQGMQHVGLSYLTLERPTSTLSGGEAQRIRTVMHLDSALTELTYVFDEPAAGLHSHDVVRVVELLHRLRDKGNTVLVVEHHRDVVAAADHVVDLGPGAGRHGGTLVFQGTPSQLEEADTLTARGMARRSVINTEPRQPTGHIQVKKASVNNLQSVDVDIPLGCFVVVTGVSGAGKTSLLCSIPRTEGLVALDQSPIRGSRRSSPATYTGALDDIRTQFARQNGVKSNLFSPNSVGGCTECNGLGCVIIVTPLGDSLTNVCPKCQGLRFNESVLAHELRNKNIAQVLSLTAEEAADFFDSTPTGFIMSRIVDVGLGYIPIGQPLNQLSGGERQRLRLSIELGHPARTYVLDEPTVGLHSADVENLVAVLRDLVARGASVIVADHHLDLIAQADYVIDLGPNAGSAGGSVVFRGTPQQLTDISTHTGFALAASSRQSAH